MRPPIRKPSPNQDQIDAREIWHKLVVKVISWQDGISERGAIALKQKISVKEWKTYAEHMLRINVTIGRQKALTKLEETRLHIKKHGGFEDCDKIRPINPA